MTIKYLTRMLTIYLNEYAQLKAGCEDPADRNEIRRPILNVKREITRILNAPANQPTSSTIPTTPEAVPSKSAAD